MPKLPLVEGIKKYIDEKNISFCMPGHKNGIGFLSTQEGRILYENFIKGDITEVDGVDNLHNPEGIIKDAQQLLSKLYGSAKSYFLVNGSTSGNLAMIFSCFNEGNKIIVERNCHRSVFNGIIMRKLKPVYIKNQVHNKYDIPLSIDMESFLETIRENKDAKGILVTYPNYYGICTDLKKIIIEAKKHNMMVLVDSAHGAHFGTHKDLPKSALELGADMVVMSAHKTLPSLTQTAYLHVGNHSKDYIEKVDFYVSAFLSTSPSYMMMASMDYARFYIENYGERAYEELITLSNYYRSKINELKGFHVLDSEDIYNINKQHTLCQRSIDLTRYVLNIEKEYSGHKLAKYLKLKGFQAEMSDERNVILIFSPFNKKEDFEQLYKALKDCSLEPLKHKYKRTIEYEIPKAELCPYEVMELNKIKVPLEECKGKISAVSIVPYPPGIPIIMPGEVIDEDIINNIIYCKNNNIVILGLENNFLSVVVEDS